MPIHFYWHWVMSACADCDVEGVRLGVDFGLTDLWNLAHMVLHHCALCIPLCTASRAGIGGLRAVASAVK